MTVRRRATATSAFGVGKRENHDARGFYARFTPPAVTKDETVNPPDPASLDRIVCGDARSMKEVADASVALVVTSPPYFAGKEYETALGQGHVPASYLEYLEMLHDVFLECRRVLEPGGRIAVNVANLGRKPYRSLSADVISILQDDLGLLLRGEIVWHKARGASGSCAWGSFQSASNPVLRDLTERIVVAGKGRLDRAVKRPERAKRGLPAVATISTDEFMEATLDVWEIPPESATRVGHPAPFPVELPRRVIELYTYEGDLVLDPFMGSGSTAVAAVRSGRHYVGYDTDPEYVAAAEARVAREGREPSVPSGSAVDAAKALLREAGLHVPDPPPRRSEADLVAVDRQGGEWHVLVAGGFGTVRGGLRRADVLWRTLGRAATLAQAVGAQRVLVLTTEAPVRSTAGAAAVRSLQGIAFAHVLVLGDPAAVEQLQALVPAGRGRRRRS
ncbi:MAG TPA: site-specific DNA-methyltransferase [Acidimicrobiales bacterium]|nr:site-specific DNA-methyltransferase [Acidimicrobiales bacterium]